MKTYAGLVAGFLLSPGCEMPSCGGDPPKSTEPVVVDITPETLGAWMQEGTIVLIDVREQAEWDAEHIAGAELRPLSIFDPTAIEADFEGKKVVFYCRSGGRSAMVAERFSTVVDEPVCHLQGGIEEWKASGRPVAKQ